MLRPFKKKKKIMEEGRASRRRAMKSRRVRIKADGSEKKKTTQLSAEM